MYVEPTYLNYAATVWSSHTLRSINKLESVQKRAARFIAKDYTGGKVVSHKYLIPYLLRISISYTYSLKCDYLCFKL